MERDTDLIFEILARIEAKMDAGFEKVATKKDFAVVGGILDALSRRLDSFRAPQA